VKLEMDRLAELKDDAAFSKFCVENFADMPVRDRESFLIAAYGEFRKTIGQEPAEEFVAERLWCFPKETADRIKREIWGGLADLYVTKGKYKTGRDKAPEIIAHWG